MVFDLQSALMPEGGVRAYLLVVVEVVVDLRKVRDALDFGIQSCVSLAPS